MRSWKRLITGGTIAIVLSVAGLTILVRATGGSALLPTLARLDLRTVGLVVGLMILYWGTDALRMMALSAALGGDLKALNSMHVSLVGAAAANLTPFNSGGEALQAYLLSRRGHTIGESTAIVAVKTFLNAVARLCLGLAIPAWLMSIDRWQMPRAIDIAMRVGLVLYTCGLLIALCLILRPQAINAMLGPVIHSRLVSRFVRPETADRLVVWVRRTTQEFRDGLAVFRRRGKGAMFMAAVWSLAGWLILISIPALLLRAFGVHVPFIETLGIAIVFYFASAYAPTPGSSGVAEIGFAALFSTVVPLSLLGPFVAVWRLLTYYLTVAVGGILMAAGVLIRGRI
ncbi:MAG: lysylphosphatidylglycerol synthase transmembrane domain-containing protein [Chloroflexota bacterium]